MDVFAVVGEPTRRSIVEMVARHGELTAMEISGRFHSSAPAISQHLKVLRDADFLTVEKRGRQRIYRLNVSAIQEIDQWVKNTRAMWDARFDRLQQFLDEEVRTANAPLAANKNKSKNKKSK